MGKVRKIVSVMIMVVIVTSLSGFSVKAQATTNRITNPRFDIAGYSWPEFYGKGGQFYQVPNITYGPVQPTSVPSSTVYIVVKSDIKLSSSSLGIEMDNFKNCNAKLIGLYPIKDGTGIARSAYYVYGVNNVSVGTHKFWVWGPWNSESEGVERSRSQKFDVVTLNVQY